MSELDTLLESGFQEAANRETFARQIEAKIKDIEGAERLIPARRIENLNKDIEKTAGSLLEQRDAAVAEREWLAHELAQLSPTAVET